MVPPKGSPALAGSSLPGSMLALRLVGGLDVLELLPLVRAETCLIVFYR
jgi:hypothetical protein